MTYQYIASDGTTYVIEVITETHFFVKKRVSDEQNNIRADKIKTTGLRMATIEKHILLSVTPSLVD